MKRLGVLGLVVALATLGCSRRPAAPPGPRPTAFGTALVEVSGNKQAAQAGMPLARPVVVQVNDADGNGVAGAEVVLQGPQGVTFAPERGLTDDSGQFSTAVTLGDLSGRYRLTALTHEKNGQAIKLVLEEIALGYQQTLGRELYHQYCDRCHDPESTRERVSNYDNLTTKPHAFTEGDVMNKLSDADLTAILSHGGPALGKSAEMPAYGYTLSPRDMRALISYIRAVSDPPDRARTLVYSGN